MCNSLLPWCWSMVVSSWPSPFCKQILKDSFFSVDASTLKEEASGTWRAGLNRDRCIFSCFWSFWLEECQDWCFLWASISGLFGYWNWNIETGWLAWVGVWERRKKTDKNTSWNVWMCSCQLSVLQRVSLGHEKRRKVLFSRVSFLNSGVIGSV